MNDNHSPIEIPENWDFSRTSFGETPVSIRLNLALKSIAPIADFPVVVRAIVKMQHPYDNGFSSQEEFETLADIEDALCDAIESAGAIGVAIVTGGGNREIYSYSKDAETVVKACYRAMEAFPSYEFKCLSANDPQWKEYWDTLYPNGVEIHQILNRMVIEQLKESGDTLEKPREIDHWVYFGEENEQKAFIEQIKNLGFKILSAKYNEENNPESRYVLNFSREDHIEHIEEIVSDLIELSLQFNGYYDGWGCNIITE